MGSRKSWLKQERAKVKLKGVNKQPLKKKLAKAQNVTDTSFKVRKIMLPHQLKAAEDAELVTRKKQSIKDLLSKLNHHNISMKKSSLEGLEELVMHYPEEILGLHLSKLIEGTARLILDEERSIRRAAFRLLDKIVSQVPESNISPFLNTLLRYLYCGMTDININIQDDSLMMLDILLSYAPMLVAASSDKILTNFLNMISSQRTQSGTSRSLTVIVGSQFTSDKWRLRVLYKLHDLLQAAVVHKKEQNTKDVKSAGSCNCRNELATSHWNNDVELNIPIHTPHYRQMCYLPGIFGGAYEKDINYSDGSYLKDFTRIMLPLLMDIWIEVSPRKSDKESFGTVVTQHGAKLLRCILNIMSHLLELLELWNLKSEVPEVVAVCKKEYMFRIFSNFPYMCLYINRENRNEDEIINLDPNCSELNLDICKLFFTFLDRREKVENCARIVNYLRTHLTRWKEEQNKQQLVEVLSHMFSKYNTDWFEDCVKTNRMLSDIIRCYMESRDQNLLELLFEVACLNGVHQRKRFTDFKKWVEFLPTLLCSSTISAHTLKKLNQLSCQKNPSFYSSLCQKLPDIINNLNCIAVTGATSVAEGRKKILNILFWIDDWSKDAMTALGNNLQCEHFDKDLTVEIVNMVKLKNVMNEDLTIVMTPS